MAARLIARGIGESTEPYRAAVEFLDTIPGVNPTAAHVILGEIDLDMTRCPTAAHLISRAGFRPCNDESAGKRRSTRVRKGAPWLKTTLVQGRGPPSARRTPTGLGAKALRTGGIRPAY